MPALILMSLPGRLTAALLNNQPMGFYQPFTIIKDAQRHGLKVKPVDITCSSGCARLRRRKGRWGTRDEGEGDEGRGERGNGKTSRISMSPRLYIPLSPHLRIPLSPCLRVPPSPSPSRPSHCVWFELRERLTRGSRTSDRLRTLKRPLCWN